MTPNRTIRTTVLCCLTLWGTAAWSETPEAPAEGEAPAAEGEAPAAEGEAPAAEGEAPAAEGDAPAAEGDAPAEGEATATPAEPPAPTGWWTPEARVAEAKVLQEIFNEMPKPERRKDVGKLVYPRNVPLVVDDIHNTTSVWGAKLQRDVHYVGISKIHTTSRLQPIGRDTAGIPYCPIACNRITDIFPHEADITIQYDGPIKDWAGKASDDSSGYKRMFGKVNKAKCSFPLMYPDAPKDTWLDPDQVTKVKNAVVAEIKRYCAE